MELIRLNESSTYEQFQESESYKQLIKTEPESEVAKQSQEMKQFITELAIEFDQLKNR